MRTVVWARSASRDFNGLVAYIAEESEPNATLVGDRIERVARNLADFAIGHFGRVEDTYEVVAPKTPFIIAYEKTETTIVILRVIHAARDWPVHSGPAAD